MNQIKEKGKKPEKKASDIFNLTFEDGIMLMKDYILGLLENLGESYSEVGGVIDQLRDEIDDKVNNNILLEGYLYPRSEKLMEQFDVDPADIAL